MEKEFASFRDFLRTGNLGPISPDLTMNEIAEVLGTPAHPDPAYWTFGKLEISFEDEAPRKVNWFQIEEAGHLKGDTERLTDRFVLSLDGFTGATKPSEFLGAVGTSVESVIFYTASDHDIEMNICAGRVLIHFRVNAGFIGDQGAKKYLDSAAASELVGDIDHRTTVDSIYSYPHPAVEKISNAIDWRAVSGQDYLNLVGKK